MRNVVRSLLLRQANAVAVTILLLTAVGAVVALVVLDREGAGDGIGRGDVIYTLCQLIPYGVVGAVLIARRPDLPFGWILGLAAVILTVVVTISMPAVLAFDDGRGSQLLLWAVGLGGLAWLPIALEGILNVRFPSGRADGRFGVVLDRLLTWGIPVVAVAAVIGSWPLEQDQFAGTKRFIDGTPVQDVADALVFGVPILILLGGIAGVSLVVRCFRSSGLERRQLQWRAAAVLLSLALFPLAVAEVLPRWLDDLWPLLSVSTLAIPVLRYDLWAIDSVVRRSAGYAMASPGSTVANLTRAVGEMLRLPYVAVVRRETVLASYGEPIADVQTWPLVHDQEHVGDLVAAPRWGTTTIGEQDRQVLATIGELVAGAVRAEALTVDLLDARQRLVSAREEERRRLRRDLHDGLGPLLTGIGLNLDAARARLEQHDDRVGTYLDNAKEASTQVIGSLRELVYGLRPPALDDLGFVGAVRLQGERLAQDAGVGIELDLPDPGRLPAAVEVAAFRAIVEGVTNAVRHSGARTVAVAVRREDDALTVSVADDGTAGNGTWHRGVGLTGMRERAQELGGSFEAGPTLLGGRIMASYPIGRREQ